MRQIRHNKKGGAKINQGNYRKHMNGIKVGAVDQNKDSKNVYCETCKEVTSFSRKIETKGELPVTMPFTTNKEGKTYWQCTQCNTQYIFEGNKVKKFNLVG